MKLPHIDTRLYRYVRFVMVYVIAITMFTGPTWFFVFGLIALFILVIRPLTEQFSPLFLWSLMGTMLVVGIVNFAHVYSQFPNRYPNEVMAFTTEFIDEIQVGNIQKAHSQMKMRSPHSQEEFGKLAAKLPTTKLELEALVYFGSVTDGYASYEINFLTEDTQVRVDVGHPLDDPSTLWVEGLTIRPMSEYVKPPTTYWMRGERYLKSE